MIGEAKSSARPVNSLLDFTPEFEVATKMAPVITVEHTASIEEIIKKRIINEDWDDVVPRELPDVAWKKNRGELPEVSQEKSKLGLGELYEREYLKKAVGYDVDTAEKETEEEKAKNEMKALFANLCSKLDALSNYHFAPRPIADEAEVRAVTTPAIAMEEVMPLHVSDARGVAPEEVYATKKGRDGVLRGETEMDQVSTVLFVLNTRHYLSLLITDLLLFPSVGTKTPTKRQKGSSSKGKKGEAGRRKAHLKAATGPWSQQSLREAKNERRAPDGTVSRQGYSRPERCEHRLWQQ
jgi:hypothetical protein